MIKQHTPGPWRYERSNPSPTTGEHLIAGAKPGYLAEVRDCGSGDVQANARLIAAAPELLDALFTALPFVEDAADDEIYKSHRVHAVLKEIRAAIAKATGETQ